MPLVHKEPAVSFADLNTVQDEPVARRVPSNLQHPKLALWLSSELRARRPRWPRPVGGPHLPTRIEPRRCSRRCISYTRSCIGRSQAAATAAAAAREHASVAQKKGSVAFARRGRARGDFSRSVPWVEVLIVSPPRFEYISFYSGVRIMLGSCCEEQEAKEAKARAEHRAATRLSESRLLSSQRVRQELYDALRCAPCTAIRKTFVFLLVHPCQPASLLSLPGSEALFAAHPRRLTSIESTPVHIRPRPSHLESFSTSTCPSVDAHRRRPTHTFAALRFDTPRAPRAATAPTASAVRLGSSATSRRRSRMMPTSPRPRAIAAATTTTSATTLTSKLSSIR